MFKLLIVLGVATTALAGQLSYQRGTGNRYNRGGAGYLGGGAYHGEASGNTFNGRFGDRVYNREDSYRYPAHAYNGASDYNGINEYKNAYNSFNGYNGARTYNNANRYNGANAFNGLTAYNGGNAYQGSNRYNNVVAYNNVNAYNRGGLSSNVAIPIVRSSSDVNPVDNSYAVDFQSADGIARAETGVTKNAGTAAEALSVRGSYNYIDTDGQQVTVNYLADENGFQPTGNVIHPSIVKSVEDQVDRAKATTGQRYGHNLHY